ncbi:RidA family protein [Marinoscillum sp. MHG1-6]|uniref:RidA family protein n=1 Tax=Marinoscillum sp. MHG1-6 TaxID=2959627 RepID=UPI00215891D5|nr:Rid family detoxifying hydrolase [Marinoscillum sp. MHG1-6]
MSKIIFAKKAPEPIGPYSQAVISGSHLFVSGQIAIDQQSGKMISTTIEEETKQVMTNIGYILEEAGLTFANIIKCSIFISDMSQFSQINAVYGEFFKENPPARETVEVSQLPKGVNVEISCIAEL